MKISVIIPVYNVEPYLKETLNSVIQQSYPDIEIICVNDGSTDGSYIQLQEFAAKDSRIKIVSHDNKGLYAARQTGIKEAKGEYILFLDGDDWLEDDTCKKIASFAQETDADIIQYGLYVETPDKDSAEAKWFDGWFNVKTDRIEGGEAIIQACYEEKRIPWNVATKAIKTELFKKAVSYQDELRINALEDFITCFYVFFFAKTWCRIDNKFYHYRLGTGMSTKRTVSIQDLRSDLQVFKGYNSIKMFISDPANHVSDKIKTIVEQYISDHLSEHFFNFIFVRMKNECNPVEWSDAFAEEAGSNVAIHILASRIARRREVIMSQERLIKENNAKLKDLENLLNEKEFMIQQVRHENDMYNQLLNEEKAHKKLLLKVSLLILLLIIVSFIMWLL